MTPTTDRDELVSIATRAIHAVANGELAPFEELFHPDALNREAITEPPACRERGPRAFFATSQWLRAAWSDLRFAFDEVVVDGDLVVTHGTMAGRHTGTFVVWTPQGTVERAFPATGKSFEVHHAHFQRVVDGQVREHWAVRDDQAMAVQLGWVPPSPLFLLQCARATARARRSAK